MAAPLLARRRILAGATVLSAAGITLFLSKRPLLLDSAQNPSAKTLSFPMTMLTSRQLKVTAVEQVNHDTKRISFELPGGKNEISGVTPGAAILTQHTPEGAWFPVFRPYTPTHDLDEPGLLQLTVKRYPGGKASTHMHSLSPGQSLTVRGPLPGYSYKPASISRDILMIGGGAGITPLYSLTKGILANPDDKTNINLVWGVNGTRDIILKDELESLEAKHPGRLRVTYVVSGPEAKPEAPSLGDENKFKKGHVTQQILSDAIKQCEAGNWGDEKGTKVFLCGPPKMEEAVAGKQGILEQLGVAKKNVHRF